MNRLQFETAVLLLQQSERLIEDLIDLGGPVMWPLLAVSLLLWTLILERYWFLARIFPGFAERRIVEELSPAEAIVLSAELTFLLRRHLRLIKTLSGILPMLGLLGTVTGIIETFELIRLFGTAEPRIVASGVSQALITTMAGLVLGLFGVAVSYDLGRRTREAERRCSERLRR
ncbi:MAG: MotA/TolQ/ExbB proton channel family protein [Methylomicrobium sp.]